MAEPTFDAFISYRRSDGAATARWLRRRLSRYRPPRDLRKSDRRLALYLDVVYERATDDFFRHEIEPALHASGHLVLVVTPDAHTPRSDGSPNWVVREIESFLGTPQANRIIVVRTAGSPTDRLPAALDERFPNIEIIDLPDRPWRAPPFTRRAEQARDALLKIVAPLCDIGREQMPALHREDQRRRQGLLAALLTVATVIAGVVAALAIVAETQRRAAATRLEQALELSDRVTLTLHQELGALPGSEAARDRMIDAACALVDELLPEAKGSVRARHGEAICAARRADIADRQADPEAARAGFERAIAIQEQISTDSRDRQDLALMHHQYGSFLERQGDYGGARNHQQKALDLATTNDDALAMSEYDTALAGLSVLSSDDETAGKLLDAALQQAEEAKRRDGQQASVEVLRLLSLVHARLGERDTRKRSYASARDHLEKATGHLREALESDPRNATLLSELASRQKSIGVLAAGEGRLADAWRARHDEIETLKALEAGGEKNEAVFGKMADALEAMGDLAYRSGDNARAQEFWASARKWRQSLIEREPDLPGNVEDVFGMELRSAIAYVTAGDLDHASAMADEALHTIEPLALAHPDRVDFAVHVLRARVVAATVRVKRDGVEPVRSDLEALARDLASAATRGDDGDRSAVAQLAETVDHLREGRFGDLDTPAAPAGLDAEALNDRGWTRLQNGDVVGARQDFEAALRLDPRYALATNNLGWLRYRTGDTAGAVALWQALLDRGGHGEAERYACANLARARSDAGKLDEAVFVLRKCVERDPLDAVSVNGLGWTEELLGRHAEALKWLSQAVEIAPENGLFHNNLGRAYQSLGQFDRAEAAWRKALALPDRDRSHQFAYENLGTVLHRLGHHAEATDAFRGEVKVAPDVPEAAFNLALALESEGKKAEAAEWYRKALALREGYGAALTGLKRVTAAQPK